MNQETIKLYLIARISEDAHFWNEKVAGAFDSPIEIFIPHQHNPWNIQHEKLSHKVYQVDIEAMQNSDIGLALPEFGSDCSFEIGWYTHSDKPTVVYIDTQLEWLRHWMVKGGIDYVVTTSEDTYRILKADPILGIKKIIHIYNLRELNKVIQEVYHAHYS